MCRSSLRLPPGYDRLKLPTNPIDIRVEFDIRQVRMVREEKRTYRVVWHLGDCLLLRESWKKERKFGLYHHFSISQYRDSLTPYTGCCGTLQT